AALRWRGVIGLWRRHSAHHRRSLPATKKRASRPFLADRGEVDDPPARRLVLFGEVSQLTKAGALRAKRAVIPPCPPVAHESLDDSQGFFPVAPMKGTTSWRGVTKPSR